ncbi:hypothetical protein ACHAW6_004333 [Cyclotella cf. meneghiniana]
MTDYRGIRAFKAPPVSLADTVDTETICNTEREEVACKVDNSDKKTPVAYSNVRKVRDSDGTTEHEREGHVIVNESRDEQATAGHGDNEQRNNQNESSDTVLNMLDKNIMPDSHKVGDTSSETRQTITKTTSAKFNLGSAIDEFLRAHSCGPRFESDEESESCYSRSMDSAASGRRCRDTPQKDQKHSAIMSPVYEVQDELRYDYEESAKDDPLESMIRILHRELDVSREAVSSLETQLSSNFPSPTQITQLVNHRRQIEELAVEKRLLETKLKITQKQLLDAKQDAANAATAMEHLQEDNKQLEDALLELKSSERILKQRLAEVDLTERSQGDQAHVRFNENLDVERKTIQQLRIDLNEANNVIKRLEKDRLRERKHYQRLMEGAANNRADLESRIEKEMEDKLEIRRKCYVLEQKVNEKKKMVRDLEFELNKMRDEVAIKIREYESVVSQLDQLKRLFRDGERQTVELGCLQDINESLHDELTSSIKENKRLREELRRVRKFSSYKTHESLRFYPSRGMEENKKGEQSESCYSIDDDYIVKKDAALTQMDDKDAVFAKALEYLIRVEHGGGNCQSTDS